MYAAVRSGRRRTIVSFVAAGLLIAGVAAAAQPALAAPVTGGTLMLHGPGTTFAGDTSRVTAVTTIKGTATFTVKVVNKGTSRGQFDVVLEPDALGDVVALKAGSVVVTDIAESSSGYFTNILAPGVAQTLTLTVKTPATATQTSSFGGRITLYNTDGPSQPLNTQAQVSYEVNVKAAVGPFVDDVYTSSVGSAAVIAEPGGQTDTAAEAIKTGKTAVFTVKLQNDSQIPAQLRVSGFFETVPCNINFLFKWPVVVKAGTVDITNAAYLGNYVTPVLAHGKSQVLTVTVSYPTQMSSTYCGMEEAILQVTGPDQTTAQTNMFVNLATT